MLGGLTSEEATENVQGVPGLSRIPLLGNLFKSRGAKRNKRTLMVFLRPTILRDAVTEAAVSSEKYNCIRAEQLQIRERAGSRGIEALRRGDWKYLPPGQFAYRNEAGAFARETIAEPGALYYLPEDSSEQNNLAARYPNIAREMRAALEKELGRSAIRSKSGAAER